MKSHDTLVFNATIYSLEKENETFSAMHIRNGRIQKLYETFLPSRLNDPPYKNMEVIDAGGKTIIPGLIDSHFHFMAAAGLYEMALNISEIQENVIEPSNLEGVREKIRQFTRKKKEKNPLSALITLFHPLKREGFRTATKLTTGFLKEL